MKIWYKNIPVRSNVCPRPVAALTIAWSGKPSIGVGMSRLSKSLTPSWPFSFRPKRENSKFKYLMNCHWIKIDYKPKDKALPSSVIKIVCEELQLLTTKRIRLSFSGPNKCGSYKFRPTDLHPFGIDLRPFKSQLVPPVKSTTPMWSGPFTLYNSTFR